MGSLMAHTDFLLGRASHRLRFCYENVGLSPSCKPPAALTYTPCRSVSRAPLPNSVLGPGGVASGRSWELVTHFLLAGRHRAGEAGKCSGEERSLRRGLLQFLC